ncbi:MAG: alpha/beta fold hydrolase [Chloroflexi bacterium]|nr:alpha/beta fold hydrolase [Chloroflexota bacterium]
MIPPNETFDGTFPFAPHFSDAPGFRMHYVDEGEGEPVVMLHGEPTWGYLYRRFIPSIAEANRVIVPDHMGFGKSETPQDREYTLRTHVENLSSLIDELDLHDITLVMQDWGGPMGSQYAVRNLSRVKRLCVLNTVIPGAQRVPPNAPVTPWFQWIGKHHDAGTLHETLGHLGSNVLSVMKIIGFENSATVDDAWIRAYSAPFPDKKSCIGAIEFPLDAYLGRMREYVLEQVGLVQELASMPAMMVEGMRDHAINPDVAIGSFRALYPDAPITILPDAGHFCQEDAPEIIVPLIRQFLRLT